jgi:hypothetical protein
MERRLAAILAADLVGQPAGFDARQASGRLG